MPTPEENKANWVLQQEASRATQALAAVQGGLPAADVCEITVVGPSGPLPDCDIVVGTGPEDAYAVRLNGDSKFTAPVGQAEFKIDTIGTQEATVAAIVDSTPRTVTLVASS